ncbi:hypothetical protein HDV05_007713 [Chytridiales sp. JEL 0842]|nr:hypothetical protein HDV05_007713 [Chytridiales sp. JEL 0842]
MSFPLDRNVRPFGLPSSSSSPFGSGSSRPPPPASSGFGMVGARPIGSAFGAHGPVGGSSALAMGGSEDDAIRGTNDDATISRCSAVTLGYLTDPYINAFVKRPTKRPPIINRGTFARYTTIDQLLRQFLRAGGGPKEKQVVVLGAGCDTRFFILKAEGINPKRYFEIDFPEITSKKSQSIKKSKLTSALLGEHKIAMGGCELHGDEYSIISGDLRSWESDIFPRLESLGFDKSLPTLYLSECVLVYLQPETISRILTHCSKICEASMFITYEQIKPDDAFGKVMVENLKLRNIHLPGLHSCPTLEAHCERYTNTGWKAAQAVSMKDAYDKHISPEEHARVAKLEIFDEVEEWELMGDHYCVSWSVSSPAGDSKYQWLYEIRLPQTIASMQ